jgi:hypothetical protein
VKIPRKRAAAQQPGGAFPFIHKVQQSGRDLIVQLIVEVLAPFKPGQLCTSTPAIDKSSWIEKPSSSGMRLNSCSTRFSISSSERSRWTACMRGESAFMAAFPFLPQA